MNDLLPSENSKGDAFSRILRFMQDSDIVLTAAEEIIMDRWIYCDVLIRQQKYREADIVEKVVAKFGVSKFTAQNDIYKAHALFEGARKVSKTYLLQHTIDDLNLMIERAKYDKSLIPMLPKLYAERTKAISLLPDQVSKETPPAPVIFIGVAPGQEAQAAGSLSFEQAKELLELKRKTQTPAEDYIDHEDVPS